MSALAAIGAVALLTYVGICVLLYVTQRSMLYFPTAESQHSSAEALYLSSGGTRLKIWHLRHSAEHAIVYFGGNAEDVAWNIDDFAAAFPTADVYLVNYRGYGGSEGAPSEAAIFADAEVVFDYVQARHREVSVIGRSLGSGVAVHLAAVRPVRKLALVTPYDSVANVAKAYLSLFPVSWLLEDRYDSLSRVADVRVPILVLLAAQDRIIARAHSERLIAAFAHGQTQTRVIAGTSHDSIAAAPEYHAALAAFLLAGAR